jgi:hypothetical protein
MSTEAPANESSESSDQEQALSDHERTKSRGAKDASKVASEHYKSDVESQLQTHYEFSPDSECEDATCDMTETEATFTILNCVMNLGLFSLPFAFAQSGYFAGLLVVTAAVVFIFQGHLLGRVLQQLGSEGIAQPTYADAAQHLFGPITVAMISGSCLLECALYFSASLIVIQQNVYHTVNHLVPELLQGQILIASCAVAWMLSAIPDKLYSYLCMLSALSIIVACTVVLASGMMMPEWDHGDLLIGPVEQIPFSSSLIVFCGATHPLLPQVFHNTRPAIFRRAVRNAWGIWGAFGITFGAGVYYMWGSRVPELVTLAVGRNLAMHPMPGGRQLQMFASILIVFRLQTGLVPNSRPLIGVLARLCGLKLRSGNGGLLCCSLSAPLFVLMGLGAHCLGHSIAMFESVSGGLVFTINSLILPSVLYLRLCTASAGSRWGALVTCILGVALVLAISIVCIVDDLMVP